METKKGVHVICIIYLLPCLKQNTGQKRTMKFWPEIKYGFTFETEGKLLIRENDARPQKIHRAPISKPITYNVLNIFLLHGYCCKCSCARRQERYQSFLPSICASGSCRPIFYNPSRYWSVKNYSTIQVPVKNFSVFLQSLNLLTHYKTTNFRLFQTERVCRQQIQIWWKWNKVIRIGRKHCEKRRNCSLRAISPFPTVFSKVLFPRGIKRCHCVGMG